MINKSVAILIITFMIFSLFVPVSVLGDETLPVAMVDLNYTRDVFVSTGEVFSDLPAKFVPSSGTPGVAGYSGTTGMQEDKLLLLKDGSNSMFSNGILNYDGVGYKFGPLGSVGQPNSAFNAIHSTDTNPIVIDIKDGIYSSIRFIANTTEAAQTSATATISYMGDSTPATTNVSRIASFRTLPSPLNTGEYLVGKIGAFKYNTTGTAAAPINGMGTYDGSLYAYYLTPDQGKIVDKITINCSKAVVYAVSTIGVNKAGIAEGIRASIARLPDVTTQQDRTIVSAIANLVDTAKTQGLTDSEINSIVGMDKFKAIDKKLIRLTGNAVSLDLDNINVGVNFSGPIDDSSINNTNITVLYSGTQIPANEFSILPINGDGGATGITLSFKNGLDYTNKCTVKLSQNIKSAIDTSLTLGSDNLIEFIPKAPFEITGFTLTNAGGTAINTVAQAVGGTITATAKLKNNTLPASQPFVVTIAVFSPLGKMIDKKITTGSREIIENEAIVTSQFEIPAEATSGYTIECYAWNSFLEMKMLFKTQIK